ncbi:MAG TPA: arsinothricin resistance N-acetyltransferase ArsN1 family A [Baekduia sp.]
MSCGEPRRGPRPFQCHSGLTPTFWHGGRTIGCGQPHLGRRIHPLTAPEQTPPITIRRADPGDAARIAAIYNEGIAERQATFETRPRGTAEVAGWTVRPLPVLVAEHEGRVVGFGRIGPYSEREVYSGIGEHAVYVASDARRLGVGHAVLEALAVAAAEIGLYKLTSRIFSTNTASIELHRRSGFTIVGVQRRHGQLDGIWRDCVLVERLVGEAADAE